MALDKIWLALNIAEAGNIPITLKAEDVRAVLERIQVLEERCTSVEERATTELAIRNSKITMLEESQRKLINALNMVEWRAPYTPATMDENQVCPWCGSWKNEGHRYDCPRLIALAWANQ